MSVYKNPKTGKWFCVYRIRDIKGKLKQKRKDGFETRELAYQYECMNVAAHKDYSKKRIKFCELYKLYYLDCKKKYKVSSLEKYNYIYEKYLYVYKETYVDKINYKALSLLQDELMMSNLSYHRINLIFRIMKDIFDFGINKLDLNVVNPVGKITKLKNETVRSNIDFYTLDEFNKFISVIPGNEYIFKVIFMTLYYTGLRIGELQALDVRDVDLKNNYIIVDKNYIRQPNGKYIISNTKTTSSSGKVRIPSTLKKELINYISNKKQNEKLFLYKKDIIKRRTIENHKNNYCSLADLRKIRLHDFRHSFASLIYELSGYNYSEVAKRLRHSDTSTVMKTYIHVFPDRENELDHKLDLI